MTIVRWILAAEIIAGSLAAKIPRHERDVQFARAPALRRSSFRMTLFLLITGGLLSLGTLCGGLYWSAVLIRSRNVAGLRYSARSGLELPDPEGGLPKLSIVVPVHNEERVIDVCATSIRNQAYDDLEIIFVLDRCTDATAAILQRHADEDPRVRLIEVDHCPDGWSGKCHAAHVGSQHTTGDWILFTDADTKFHEDLCTATVRLAHHRDLALLSLLSTLTSSRGFERIVQPVASMVLIKMFPLERVNRDQDARAFANGQFLLFKRSWYDTIGGHESVHSELLEDIAFARRVAEMNGRGWVILAKDMLICSMYDSFEAFRKGWRRIFQEACRRRPHRLRKHGRRVLFSSIALNTMQFGSLAIAFGLLVAGHPWVALPIALLAGLSLLAQIIALRSIYSVAGAPPQAMWLYPAGCWIVSRILHNAARDLSAGTPVEWGGRSYVLKPRT